jgi:hypothetical protein
MDVKVQPVSRLNQYGIWRIRMDFNALFTVLISRTKKRGDYSHPLSVHSPEVEQELASFSLTGAAHSVFVEDAELYFWYSK